MIDLFSLKAYTDGVDVNELRLVHHTLAGGGPGWGLMRAGEGRLTGWLALETDDRAEAVKIIEEVGLAPYRDLDGTDSQRDVIMSLQPGSERAVSEPPL
jgi:hypothetical protein